MRVTLVYFDTKKKKKNSMKDQKSKKKAKPQTSETHRPTPLLNAHSIISIHLENVALDLERGRLFLQLHTHGHEDKATIPSMYMEIADPQGVKN